MDRCRHLCRCAGTGREGRILISHIETIIANKSLTANTHDSLVEFDGSSLRTRKFKIGRARALNLLASIGDISSDNVELRLTSHATRNELFGLEYKIESPSTFIDYFKDDSLLFEPDELLKITVNSTNADFVQTYLTIFYDQPEKEVFGSFISASELLTLRRSKVTKAISFTMNTTAAPSWKSIASLLSSFNGSSRYALLGATSKQYEFDGGGQLNPYVFIMSGKVTGGTLLTFPANVQMMGFEHTANYFPRLSEDFGDIRCIPVLNGRELQSTFLDLYGDGSSAETFRGTLHFVELK